MEVHCTRPGCPRPLNIFTDLDNTATLRTVQQKFCTTCGMPLLLAGRYLPSKLLGQGGFGAAFLARDRYTPTMRSCVVKQFQPSGDLNPQQLEVAQGLFEREALVLESLGNKHPQIPDLLAFFEINVPSPAAGKASSFFYLVQELIDGENLEEEMERRGPFSEAEIREVLQAILPVLQFVHDNQSIHRDIKPSNIMRRRDGRLFLLDFGAVKQVTATAGMSASKGSTGIYSMGFAPPEQMRGDVVYPATDLYALGVTCVTLLTGKQPNELYDAYRNTWDWQSHTTVGDRLRQILDKLLQPTPSQRFQSADEVVDALNQGGAPGRSPASPATSGGAAAMPAPSPTSTSLQSSSSAPNTSPPPAQAVPAQPIAAQAQAQSLAPAKAAQAKPAAPPMPLMEYLTSAAFTGAEGGLLAIALISLFGTTMVNPVFWIPWLGIVGALLFAQSRRWLDWKDILLLAIITFLVVMFMPWFNTAITGNPWAIIPILAILTGLVAIVVGILFRLIYLLVSKLL
ncbi:protein kinase domain-containing protein [Vacuolonema iberomarrocanum]|uniref:protein kinase domain-containing protein n=1 Tax=Vacuolonema iberomarrocanum TaxID=3454632 RepID=UPI0019F78DC2|nr:serine/threonine protein kinase [filamentous cyanobacterium LEGE 07170]